jgi:hypothetical protein
LVGVGVPALQLFTIHHVTLAPGSDIYVNFSEVLDCPIPPGRGVTLRHIGVSAQARSSGQCVDPGATVMPWMSQSGGT